MKRWLLPAVLILASGCAGEPVRQGAVTMAPGEKVVDLRAGSYFFSPAVLAIRAGEPVVVRVVNEATFIPHSFVLEGANGNVLIRQRLQKGGETLIRLSPLAAGTYSFYCGESFLGTTHRGKGMAGKLEVTSAN